MKDIPAHHTCMRSGHSWCCAGGVVAEVQQYVRARALECEECIFTASGQADAPEEPETTETGTCMLHRTMARLNSCAFGIGTGFGASTSASLCLDKSS